MSVQALSWVFDKSPTTGTDRLVLLALANHASSDAWECYPSIATLAREAGIARPRTVQQSLARMEANGHVERSINGAVDQRIRTDRRPNLYRILHGVSLSDTPSEERGVASGPNGVSLRAERGVASRTNGVSPNDTQTVNRTVITTVSEPSGGEAPQRVVKPSPSRPLTEAALEDLRARYGPLLADVDADIRFWLNTNHWAHARDKPAALEAKLKAKAEGRTNGNGKHGTPSFFDEYATVR